MHSYRSRLLLSNAHELIYDIFGRTCSVRKVQFIMSDPSLFELIAIIGLVVQANNCCYSHFFEDRHIVLGREVGTLNT